MENVLIVVGDACEALDTFYPIFRLKEAGFRPVVAGPEKRIYHTVLHDLLPGWDVTRELPGYHLQATACFGELQAEDLEGAFYTGGRAPEYLRYDQDLMRLTRDIFDAEKPIACVCHGIEILARSGCIKGRRVTTVAKCRADAEQGGADYVNEPVVVDGNLVTGRTWHDNGPFVGAWIHMLQERRGN